MGHCGRLVGRAPDVDEGDGGVEPVKDDEGHRRVAQEGPQQLAVELDAIQLCLMIINYFLVPVQFIDVIVHVIQVQKPT